MQVVGTEGLSFAPVRFVLGQRLSVANFARALDIDDPLFTDVAHARARGYAGRPVPPTMYAFFQTVTDGQLRDQLGFTWGRTLGAGLEMEAGAALGEEEEVVGRSMVEAAWETEGRDGGTRQLLRLRTDVCRPDGAVACRWRALFLERRSGPPDPRAAPAPSDPVGAEPVARADDLGPAPDATVGLSLPGHRMGPVDRLRLARVSIAIDNPDPLHVDDEVARAAGFPTVVGQGSGAAGVLYETVRRWAGLDRVVAGSVRLSAPYSLGAVLSSAGTVTALEDHGGEPTAVCDVSLQDRDGTGIATGQFRVVL